MTPPCVVPTFRPYAAENLEFGGFYASSCESRVNNTMNSSDAQRPEDRARHRDGRSEQGQYRRPTSEFRGYNRNGTDQGDYGDRRSNGQRW